MSGIGINAVFANNFSANNRFAQEYYNTCKQLAETKYRLVHSESATAVQKRELGKKVETLENKAHQVSMKAKNEELRLELQQNDEQPVLGKNLNIMA